MTKPGPGKEGDQRHDWMTLRIVPGTRREDVLAALFHSGVQAVQEIDGGFATSVRGEHVAADLKDSVLAASPDARVEVSPLPDVDWTKEWKKSVRSHDLGALTVCPPWLAEGKDPGRTIVIDPAMAFGTGEHQTTRGVLRLLQDVIRPGDRVADLGAGSAVLAIGAVKLGAASAVAIELDHDAIENAEENTRRNGVADRVTVIEGDAALLLPLVAPVRVVTANIIAGVLVELLPAIAAALTPDGEAILSGILVAERDEMLGVLADGGWTVKKEDAEEAWWSVLIARL
ncbi:MAG TPA: 50S ribosomal protein L11 methyltransferase [Gemmatimonadaceae bacterium]|nr:50S ribosomal protein L11 methyltransferase [Gemmatimonadaceae bacterium]